jgi:ParB-like nuclease domain
MLEHESFPIAKIYVPVKRRATLRPEAVQEIAESMLEIGQAAPILVRRDEDRFVLVEGLHWRLAKRSARRQLSVFWCRVRVTKPRHLTMPRQMVPVKVAASEGRRVLREGR